MSTMSTMDRQDHHEPIDRSPGKPLSFLSGFACSFHIGQSVPPGMALPLILVGCASIWSTA